MIQWCWQFDLWFLCFSKNSLYIWKFSVHALLKPSSKDFEYCLIGMWNEYSCAYFEHSLAFSFFEIEMKNDLFQFWTIFLTFQKIFIFKWAKKTPLGQLIFIFRSSDHVYAIYSPNKTLLYLHCSFCYYYAFILVSAVIDDLIVSVTDHIMLNTFSDMVVIKYFLNEDFWNFQMVWDLSFGGIY